MHNSREVTVRLVQMSRFPRVMTLEMLLGEQMSYGFFRNGHLSRQKTGLSGYTAYLKEAIGRGIQVRARREEDKEITLVLSLPCSSEEINAFYAMMQRVSEQWTCSIYLNGQGVTRENLHDLRESLDAENHKLLRMSLAEINAEGGHELLILPCAMHRLIIGRKEAEYFCSGPMTSRFSFWMHARQVRSVYLPEGEIFERRSDLRKIAVYTVPTNVPVVFPTEKVPAEKYYNKELKRYTEEIDEMSIRLYSAELQQVLGYLEADRFLQRLPKAKYEYYDGGNILVEPLNNEDMYYLLEQENYEFSENI